MLDMKKEFFPKFILAKICIIILKNNTISWSSSHILRCQNRWNAPESIPQHSFYTHNLCDIRWYLMWYPWYFDTNDALWYTWYRWYVTIQMIPYNAHNTNDTLWYTIPMIPYDTWYQWYLTTHIHTLCDAHDISMTYVTPMMPHDALRDTHDALHNASWCLTQRPWCLIMPYAMPYYALRDAHDASLCLTWHPWCLIMPYVIPHDALCDADNTSWCLTWYLSYLNMHKHTFDVASLVSLPLLWLICVVLPRHQAAAVVVGTRLPPLVADAEWLSGFPKTAAWN